MRIPIKIKQKIFADEYREMREVFEIMANAVQMGRLSERDFGAELDGILSETSSPWVEEIIRSRRQLFNMRPTTQHDREISIQEAMWFSSHNNNIKLANRLWTSFAMGVQVKIASPNIKADKILKDFQEATYNQKVLGVRHQQELSNNALNEGELALSLWYSKMDGKAPSVKPINTLNLNPIYDPLHDGIEVFYTSKTKLGVLVYPDWLSTAEQKERAAKDFTHDLIRLDRGMIDGKQIDGLGDDITKMANFATVVFAQRNVDRFIRRGMPQFANGFVWADILRSYMGDIAAVARKAAMYTEKVKIDGGSRHIKDAANQISARFDGLGLNQNPNPVAGSDWLENEQVVREWMNRPTYAGDARWTGQLLAGQLSVVTGVPLQWMGFPWAMNNRATADNVIIPWLEEIKTYNVWLRSFYHDLGEAVLMIYDQSQNTNLAESDINVIMQTPLNIDVEFVLSLMSGILTSIKDGVINSEKGGVIVNTLLEMIMTKIGVDNAGQYQVFDTSSVSEVYQELLTERVEKYAEALANHEIDESVFVDLILGEITGE